MAKQTQLIDYNGGANAIYIGYAQQGSSARTASPIWEISKLTYDGSNNVTKIEWVNNATGTGAIWDNRATYTYA